MTTQDDFTAALRPRLLAIMRAHPDRQEWTVEQLRSAGDLPFWQPIRTALHLLTQQGHLLISVHSTGPKYTYSLVSVCECGCGGAPREDDIEMGVRTPAGTVVPLGPHTPGHDYAKPTDGNEWVARHPGGQWTTLTPAGPITP